MTSDSGLVTTPYGPLPARYQCAKLAEVCVGDGGVQTGPFGSQLHKADYTAVGTPIITVEHLGENRILHRDLPLVSDEDRQRLSRYSLRSGDIVFSRVGSVDLRALVREEEDGWLFSGRCLRVRPEPDVVDSEYLSWFFGLPGFRDYVRRIAFGATMPSLNTQLLGELPIYFPPMPEQRAIAHVLGTLDDKIELNRRMNETLEAIARAIFKSWFVDFDPVRAKAEGRDPPAMDAETAVLFPDAFEHSVLGAIPRGWRVTQVGEVVEIIKGRSYASSELGESDTALVTLKSFRRGGGYRPEGLKPFTGTYKPDQIVRPGELVVAYTDVTQAADVIGKPAIVLGDARFRTLVASLDLAIIRPQGDAVSTLFLYCLFRTDDFQSHVYGHTTGTTVLHLSASGVPSYLFARPPTALTQVFSSIAEPLFDSIQANERESASLAAVRDALLPKLISGKLRVKDAEEFFAEVMP